MTTVVAEGITVGEQEGLDPNNSADFAAILEGRGVPKTEEDSGSPDTSIASGLTVAGPEQPRDPKSGKFVPNTPVAQDTSAEDATDTSGEVAEEQADPAVESFLAKYGGDVDKALKGAAEAQSLIGRRSETEQALQEKIANIEGKLEALTSVQTQQPVVRLSDDQVVEVATNEIERKGYEQAAVEAANWSHTKGDERAYRTILEQWQLEDPIAAMDFNTDFRIWQRDARQQAETAASDPPVPPQWQVQAEQQAAQAAMNTTVVAVAAERGLANDSPVFAHMLPALEGMPPNVAEMVASNDSEARAAGIRIVMDRATLLAGAVPKTPEVVAEQAVAASVERKLAGAAVASGSLRPAEKAPPGAPQNREDAIREFKRQIVEAETTNVASGLTYGPTL